MRGSLVDKRNPQSLVIDTQIGQTRETKGTKDDKVI